MSQIQFVFHLFIKSSLARSFTHKAAKEYPNSLNNQPTMGGDPSYWVEFKIGGYDYSTSFAKSQLQALVAKAEYKLKTQGLTQQEKDENSNLNGKLIEFQSRGHKAAINFSVRVTTPVGEDAVASHFVMFCDASVTHPEEWGGVGVCWVCVDGVHEGWNTDGCEYESFAISEAVGNNVAEETALHCAHRILFRELKRWFDRYEGKSEVPSRPINIDILTDSLSALKMANKAWHGIPGACDKLPEDYQRRFLEPLEMIQRQTGAFNNAQGFQSGSKVSLKLREGWLPGHCNVFGNEVANALATLGRLAATLIPPAAYMPGHTPVFSLSSMCLYNDLSPLRGPVFPDRTDYPHPNRVLTKTLYELFLEYHKQDTSEKIEKFLQELIQSIMSSPTALFYGRDVNGDVEMFDYGL
ncbi:hypothetical protein GGR57DRAFT_520226 [Xylariaceae sp. FL1272]|nr:hypothetical protein GGR57DRAFT_520226 [Xylariaceae sp. FL1272]